jgi:hypothetical protein
MHDKNVSTIFRLTLTKHLSVILGKSEKIGHTSVYILNTNIPIIKGNFHFGQSISSDFVSKIVLTLHNTHSLSIGPEQIKYVQASMRAND